MTARNVASSISGFGSGSVGVSGSTLGMLGTVRLAAQSDFSSGCVTMALTSSDLERLAAWCDTSIELASVRNAARATFFGTDDDGPADYGSDLGDYASRHRRFLGWFMFQATLSDGQHPADHAARALFEGEQRAVAERAIAQARYVMAVVSSILPGRGVILELEHEHFEVRSRAWAQLMRCDAPVLAHLVPVRPGAWLPGPGWLEWPVAVGPNMRGELRRYQPDPIEVERVLQGRSRRSPSDIERPTDTTFREGVARMTQAAKKVGRLGLVRPEAEWEALVLRHLVAQADFASFAQEIVARVGDVRQVQELNQWLALAQNIWNATPQPDRGGRTAYELASQSSRSEMEIESWHD